MLLLVAPSVGGDGVWWCFAAFWLLNMVVVWRGIETIKSLQDRLLALRNRRGGEGENLWKNGHRHGFCANRSGEGPVNFNSIHG